MCKYSSYKMINVSEFLKQISINNTYKTYIFQNKLLCKPKTVCIKKTIFYAYI